MRLSLLEWILAGVAAFLLVLCLVLAWQGRSLKRSNAELASQNAIYVEANESNQQAIEFLKVANAEWAERCRVEPGAQDDAVDTLTEQLNQARADLAEARQNREVIYANDPASRDWSAGSLPAPVADSLFPDDRQD